MVKRFDFDYDGGDTLGVHERPAGDYVEFADYDALAARLADVESRLTDAIAKHGEVSRLYGESQARLAEVEAEHAAFSNNVEQCEAENDALRSRLSEAEALLREIREDALHFGMPTTRIDAFLEPDSASHRENDSHE